MPDLWRAAAYPSLCPLASWLEDLWKRLDMLATWDRQGPPPAFWLPGFFFVQVRVRVCLCVPACCGHALGYQRAVQEWHVELTSPGQQAAARLTCRCPVSLRPQSFLTAALQNYARRARLPIDSIAFDFEIAR